LKLLVALDWSQASDVVLNDLANRPFAPGTAIEVLSVVEPPPLWTVSEVEEEVSRRTQTLVQTAVKRLENIRATVTSVVFSGDPKSVIVDRAGKTGADFVILGSHGAAGVTRFLLGSVAQGVVRFAPCSVEVVRARSSEHTGMRILLATDGSQHSLGAARSVAARPWPDGTEVRVLSVVELALTNLQAAFEPPFLDSERMEAVRAAGMKHAEDAVAEAEQIIRAVGLTTSESISVLVESPKKIILDEAVEWGADLIVVGSHGRRGIDRFLLGSVSEAIATHAACSVDVIR
jgi:nucleotide-binding universal stress UspA family protein